MTMHWDNVSDGNPTTDLGDGLSRPLFQRDEGVNGAVAVLNEENDNKQCQSASKNLDEGQKQIWWQAILNQLQGCDEVPDGKMYKLPRYHDRGTNFKHNSTSCEGEDTELEQEGDYILAFMLKAQTRDACSQTLLQELPADQVGCASNAEPRGGQELQLESTRQQPWEHNGVALSLSNTNVSARNRARAFRKLLEVVCVYLVRTADADAEFRFAARLDTGADNSFIIKERVPEEYAQYRPLEPEMEFATASGETLIVKEYVDLEWWLLCSVPGEHMKSRFLVVEGSKTALAGYDALIGVEDSERTGHVIFKDCQGCRLRSPVSFEHH
ncbi:hypothetical protein RBB50_003240 [Rhinocladiella similis]